MNAEGADPDAVKNRRVVGISSRSMARPSSTGAEAEKQREKMRIEGENMTTAQHDDMTDMAFVSRLVHDLGAPIGGLRSVVTLLDAVMDDRVRSLATGNLEILLALLGQAYQYILARRINLHCTLLPLAPLCEMALSTIALRAQQLDITIRTEIAADLQVWGEETAIVRILDNLLANALGVTPPGGTIVLRASVPDTSLVEIAIIDQGPGIPLERVATLFRDPTPSTTLRPSTTGSGLGLGLVIVAELVTMLGGCYGVESQVGAGCRFYVQLLSRNPFLTDPEEVTRTLDELFAAEMRATLAEPER
jgi:signal transduction histidine kinase